MFYFWKEYLPSNFAGTIDLARSGLVLFLQAGAPKPNPQPATTIFYPLPIETGIVLP